MYRVAIIALFHETNTFSKTPTDRAAFAAEGWYVGQTLLDRYRGSKTVVGGFLDGLAERAMEPVGVFGAYAIPAGRVTDGAIREIVNQTTDGLAAAEPYDGVLIELHGAMVAEHSEDPEGEAVAHIRATVGDRPIVAVTDFHANMTSQRLQATDMLVGYRTNPHIDTWETGRSAARHLSDLLAGASRPHVIFGTIPAVAPAIGQATSMWPMGEWLLRSHQLERRHDFADLTVHGGYAYADVSHAGMAVTISTRGEADVAIAAARELCNRAWDMRHELVPRLPSVDEAIARAKDASGLVALADTGDNINGGSPGTHLELLAGNAGAELRTLGTWVDGPLLRVALDARVGDRIALPHALVDATQADEAIVLSHMSGTWVNKGPMATGKKMDMGRSAVLRIGHVDLVLQGRATQPNDPEMFRSAGLEPTDYRVVLLKGASALRAGWTDITTAFIAVATPGESDSDLTRLRYRTITDQVWPLAARPSRAIEVVQIR